MNLDMPVQISEILDNSTANEQKLIRFLKYSLIIPRVVKVMSTIFVVISRMLLALGYDYHECVARVIIASASHMSGCTAKIVYLTLTTNGIRGTIHRTKALFKIYFRKIELHAYPFP